MAPAGRARHRGGRGRGRGAADAAARPLPSRSRSRREPTSARRRSRRPRRSATRPAVALRRPDRARARACWSLIVRRPPRRLAGAAPALLAGAAVAAAISVADRGRALPLRRGRARPREGRRAGHAGVAGWLGDRAKAQAIGAVLRRASAARVLVFGDAPLRPPLVDAGRGRGGRLRRDHDLRRPDPARPALQPLQAACRRASCARDVLELAREAGVDVGQVYEMDASRRTTAANAYVTGLGHTKRVVLYDTLLRRLHAGRGASSSPTSSGTSITTTSATASSGSRSWRRSGCWAVAALVERLAPRGGGAGRRRGAGRRAGDRDRRAGR